MEQAQTRHAENRYDGALYFSPQESLSDPIDVYNSTHPKVDKLKQVRWPPFLPTI